MTREQALTGNEFHIDRPGARVRGCERWRRNGANKLWKRSPERFRIPIKFGLYDYAYITEDNINRFHLASECPRARKEQ